MIFMETVLANWFLLLMIELPYPKKKKKNKRVTAGWIEQQKFDTRKKSFIEHTLEKKINITFEKKVFMSLIPWIKGFHNYFLREST